MSVSGLWSEGEYESVVLVPLHGEDRDESYWFGRGARRWWRQRDPLSRVAVGDKRPCTRGHL